MTEDTTDSTTVSALETLTDMQRETIEQSQRLMERSAQMPAEIATSMQSMATEHTEFHHKTIDIGEATIDDILDLLEQTTVGGEDSIAAMRSAVDEGFDELRTAHDEAVEQADDIADETIDEYETAVENTVETINTQLDILAETNDTFTARSLDAFEDIIDQYERLQAEVDAQADALPADLREQVAELETRIDDQLTEYQERLNEFETRFTTIDDNEQ